MFTRRIGREALFFARLKHTRPPVPDSRAGHLNLTLEHMVERASEAPEKYNKSRKQIHELGREKLSALTELDMFFLRTYWPHFGLYDADKVTILAAPYQEVSRTGAYFLQRITEGGFTNYESQIHDIILELLKWLIQSKKHTYSQAMVILKGYDFRWAHEQRAIQLQAEMRDQYVPLIKAWESKKVNNEGWRAKIHPLDYGFAEDEIFKSLRDPNYWLTCHIKARKNDFAHEILNEDPESKPENAWRINL